MVGEADAAESGVGAVPGQGAAQAAVAALPGGHGGGRRADGPFLHPDRQLGAAVQGVWLPGVGAVADPAGPPDAVLLTACLLPPPMISLKDCRCSSTSPLRKPGAIIKSIQH